MGRPHDRVCPHKGAPRFERRPVISSHYRNRVARQMPEYEDPGPPPDFKVQGSLTPAANGAYYEFGTHDGKPYYRRRNGRPYFLWYEDLWETDAYVWIITATLGDLGEPRWAKATGSYQPPPGSYEPDNGAVGTATVTAY